MFDHITPYRYKNSVAFSAQLLNVSGQWQMTIHSHPKVGGLGTASEYGQEARSCVGVLN